MTSHPSESPRSEKHSSEPDRLQTRREFVVRTCQAATLALLTLPLADLLEGCSSPSNPADGSIPSLPTVAGTLSGNVVTVAVGSGSPLATAGNAALVQFGSSYVLAARISDTAFAALSAVCTHQGCLVSDYSNQQYFCPCHGSKFGTDGHVITGPASQPLLSYRTSFSSNLLTITIS